jgi:hypothetical protein
VVLPGDWLMSSISFCPQSKLQLGGEVSLPVRAGWQKLLFSPGDSCIPLQLQLWSVPPPTRWGNSVLNTGLCPIRSALGSTIALLWEVGLSLHPNSQPLLLLPHSFIESSALRVWLLAPPPLSGTSSVFHPYLCCRW